MGLEQSKDGNRVTSLHSPFYDA